MSFSTLTITLNTSGLPNVSSTLTTSDYGSAAAVAQTIAKTGGYWTNTAAGGVNNQFIPASAILFVTIS